MAPASVSRTCRARSRARDGLRFTDFGFDFGFRRSAMVLVPVPAGCGRGLDDVIDLDELIEQRREAAEGECVLGVAPRMRGVFVHLEEDAVDARPDARAPPPRRPRARSAR